MQCQSCHQRTALERNGEPVALNMFGMADGYFCEECVLEIQRPFEVALRRSVAERAPQLTEADLARFPGQMLKFTVMLPIPSGS
jgi:hypothetical protein